VETGKPFATIERLLRLFKSAVDRGHQGYTCIRKIKVIEVNLLSENLDFLFS
jgi:hypothetical protein